MRSILVDTSVWVEHFRHTNSALQSLLAADQILCHPLILLEIACGTPPAPRQRTLSSLKLLRQAAIATADETLALIERERLYDSGCGAIDVALLAATLLSSESMLWTRDKKLDTLAKRLEISWHPPCH